METTREPYEFLVRWIPVGVPDNQYAGTVQAQINFAFVTRDGEVVVSWTPDPKGPFHVALSGEDGIALSEIVPGLNAAALVQLQQTQAAKAAADNALAQKETELAEALAAATQADADAAQSAQLALADARAAHAAIEAELAEALELVAKRDAEIVALTPPPAPAFPPVSRMQAVLALHDAGLLERINEVIAAADARTRLAWETATDFHRSSPTIAALWQAIGGTPDQLDALFVAAQRIEV